MLLNKEVILDLQTEKTTHNYLSILMVCYVSVLLFSNWYAGRLIEIDNIVTAPPAMIFPLTYLLSDVITEVYGYKYARRAIQIGFCINIVFMFLGYLVSLMPSPDFMTAKNKVFDGMIISSMLVTCASMISYAAVEPINSMLMAKLKIFQQGKAMWVRMLVSTVAAAFFDSFLFVFIAFFFTLSLWQLVGMWIAMWIQKVIAQLIALFFSVRGAAKLKKLEHQDRYDYNTKFNPLSTDIKY